ncbi:hypothetical protein [Cupriavidus necator]
MTFEQDGFWDEARNIASEQRARYADLAMASRRPQVSSAGRSGVGSAL